MVTRETLAEGAALLSIFVCMFLWMFV